MNGPDIEILINIHFLEFRPVDISVDGGGGLRDVSGYKLDL